MYICAFKPRNMQTEHFNAIALCQIGGIGPLTARKLVEAMGSAEAVMHASKADLRAVGTSEHSVQLIVNGREEALAAAEKECLRMERAGVVSYLATEADYPYRLRMCEDAPLVLYGNRQIDLNKQHFVAIVGTRNATDYGRAMVHAFVKELAAIRKDVTIVSGLAYGVDVNAHRAALEEGLRTVAVVGHGLHTLYPSVHRNVAQTMTERGGAVLSEYTMTENACPEQFLMRNRIVAGMSDAVVVVESAYKGGSLSTARHAMGYNRDVFAFPGRVGDVNSEGCNKLIQSNIACLITSASDFLDNMGWSSPAEPTLFPLTSEVESFTADELKVMTSLRNSSDPVPLMTLLDVTGLPMHKLKSLLTKLEFKGHIAQLAGEKYRIS